MCVDVRTLLDLTPDFDPGFLVTPDFCDEGGQGRTCSLLYPDFAH